MASTRFDGKSMLPNDDIQLQDSLNCLTRVKPVGLENFGATCYVNVCLQMWFRNRAFKNSVLMWNDMKDEDDLWHFRASYEPQISPVGINKFRYKEIFGDIFVAYNVHSLLHIHENLNISAA